MQSCTDKYDQMWDIKKGNFLFTTAKFYDPLYDILYVSNMWHIKDLEISQWHVRINPLKRVKPDPKKCVVSVVSLFFFCPKHPLM